jgi:hypothetical protein
VTYFYNGRNNIPYIQYIKIINASRDGVSDIKTVEEITMKKPKIVFDLLTVADVCIEASEIRARHLESRGKGTSRNKDDHEVNIADWGDRKDRVDHEYHGKQSSEQKEKRPFRHLDDAEKWCEIHHTVGNDLEEYKTFLDHKKMPPPVAPAPQDPCWGEHRREDPDGDEHMVEINVIFAGSMSITSKTQGKRLQCEITLAQWIESGTRMRWSDIGISFKLEDHPDMELSDKNLPFLVKIPIGQHKVAKTLIDSGASLNLMMRKTFIEMGLNLAELTPVHHTFHGIIPGQSSTPIRRIDLVVSCRSGGNKRREMLTFVVASFDIGYNCILGRHFLLKFMAVIHTTYATIKMLGPKGAITLKSDQCDALACENAALTHAGRFDEKEAQELVAKMAKTHRRSTLVRTVAPKPPTGGTPRPPTEKKSTFVGSTSNQSAVNQSVDDKKGSTDKEIPVDPNNTNKKHHLSTELEPK